MFHPGDCPEFEYTDNPRHEQILRSVLPNVIRLFLAPEAVIFSDTRPAHHLLFVHLCPAGSEYLAGHYRGEDFRCLKFRPVYIASDPRVGYPPALVARSMADLARTIRVELAAIGLANARPIASMPKAERLKNAVALACRIFVQFLTIHPYANGNGHIARFIMIGLMARQGYKLKSFKIHPRPLDPPYSDLIKLYRDGNVEPFERYILMQLEQRASPSRG